MVNAPIGIVYKRWLAFEDYPKFITAIKRVRKLDANHFVASLGLNGKEYETTLEMILRVPERRLAWRTLADPRVPDHFAAGVVSFAPLSDQSTCVTLKLTSSFGGAVSRRIGIYLQNFKKMIELRRREQTDADDQQQRSDPFSRLLKQSNALAIRLSTRPVTP
jgi:uncharacterized membrane protein